MTQSPNPTTPASDPKTGQPAVVPPQTEAEKQKLAADKAKAAAAS